MALWHQQYLDSITNNLFTDGPLCFVTPGILYIVYPVHTTAIPPNKLLDSGVLFTVVPERMLPLDGAFCNFAHEKRIIGPLDAAGLKVLVVLCLHPFFSPFVSEIISRIGTRHENSDREETLNLTVPSFSSVLLTCRWSQGLDHRPYARIPFGLQGEMTPPNHDSSKSIL